MKKLNNLNIKIFADGADLESIKAFNKHDYIKGFTTNPSLMKKVGIKDYKKFALELLGEIKDKPISFEVFSDDIYEMEKQAEEISTWGKNVNVKIPITNTKKESTAKIIKRLSESGIVCNITAIFTLKQIETVINVLDKSTPAILSVFAGRIADAGQARRFRLRERLGRTVEVVSDETSQARTSFARCASPGMAHGEGTESQVGRRARFPNPDQL